MGNRSYVVSLLLGLAGMVLCAGMAISQAVRQAVEKWAVTIIVVFSLAVLAGILVTLLVYVGHGLLKLRERRAELHKLELEAGIIRAPWNEQLYVPDDDKTYRPFHRDPRTRINGAAGEASSQEIAAYVTWQTTVRRGSTRPWQTVTPDVPQLAGPEPALLDELRDYNNLLVVGKDGGGKTTVLQHMIEAWPGDTFAVDPHDDTHTWPSKTQVVGAGNDWRAIAAFLAWFHEEVVNARYKLRATGAGLDGPPILVAMDEHMDIVNYAEGAGAHIRGGLTGGRKIGCAMVIGSHSDRPMALGLRFADLLKLFYIVRLQGDFRTGISGTLQKGADQPAYPVRLPGPYSPGGVALPGSASNGLRAWSVADHLPAQPQLDDIERKVLAYWDGTPAEDRNTSQAGAAGYGRRGGWQTERATEVLRKHGRL